MNDSVDRRAFIKTAGLAAGAFSLAAAALSGCGMLKKGRKRPNILFILSDDHAAPAIGAYGGFLSGVVKTPHLDRLAKEGMRFTDCFCTNSICTPSRATILTGKYSHQNGVRTLNDTLDPSLQTFPKLLQASGYHTGVVGKWHLNSEPAGFDDYNVLPGQGDYFNPRFKEKGKPWGNGNMGGEVRQGYVTDIITDLALEFLKNRPREKPFCLLYHHKAPHDMWEYDEKHAHLFEGMDIPEPVNLFDDYRNRGNAIKRATQKIGMKETLFLHGTQGKQFSAVQSEISSLDPVQQKRKAYRYFIKAVLRCVASLDENVGRVLNCLDESGLAKNTVVVYTSDQGVFLGEHGLFDKRFMYEESIRMPLLVRYPREIKPGSINRDIVSNVDFARTLLDYAGLPAPADMEGSSLRPLCKGVPSTDLRQSLYYRYWMHLAHFNVAAHYGLRTRRYKLIYYYGLPLGASGAVQKPTPPEWELFDLEADPREMHNVYDHPTYADIAKKMKAELLRRKTELGDLDDRFPEMVEPNKKYW